MSTEQEQPAAGEWTHHVNEIYKGSGLENFVGIALNEHEAWKITDVHNAALRSERQQLKDTQSSLHNAFREIARLASQQQDTKRKDEALKVWFDLLMTDGEAPQHTRTELIGICKAAMSREVKPETTIEDATFGDLSL